MNNERKIIHIDMDCFYASIEMRENPNLKGQAVAVGGTPQQRGVLATCNYEARKFGLHSAMSSAEALKRCPHLILLPVNMPLYRQVSAQIHQIFKQYTHIIEPLSLDEAYLDVSFSDLCSGSATWMAQQIRQQIWQELQLTASAGIAPLKFLAKIASDLNKPNGQYTITPTQVNDFIKNLPLKKLPGVGKVMQKKLAQMGLHTCQDIQQNSLINLIQHFSKFGQKLWDYSHGIDNRPVNAHTIRKSLGIETTLLQDIHSLEQAKPILEQLFLKLQQRIQAQCSHIPKHEFKKLSIKLKFDDFTQTTLERTTDGLNKTHFDHLLTQIWQRRNNRKIRLIGMAITIPQTNPAQQLKLWE